MNRSNIENIAIDLWEERIFSGLVITDAPKESFIKFSNFIKEFSPNVEVRSLFNEVVLGDRKVKFCSITSLKDAYCHAGAQYNAIYMSWIVDYEAREYIKSRLLCQKRERIYIEYI